MSSPTNPGQVPQQLLDLLSAAETAREDSEAKLQAATQAQQAVAKAQQDANAAVQAAQNQANQDQQEANAAHQKLLDETGAFQQAFMQYFQMGGGGSPAARPAPKPQQGGRR